MTKLTPGQPEPVKGVDAASVWRPVGSLRSWARTRLAQRNPSDHAIVEALKHLREAGCPACRSCADAEDAYFRWFAIEGYSEPTVIARLRARPGLCPAHSRRILRYPDPGIPTSVYLHAVRAGRPLAERTRVEFGSCQACEVVYAAGDRASYWVVSSVAEERVRSAYLERGGFCLPHFLRSLPRARRDVHDFITDVLAERLEGAGPDSLLTLVSVPDADAPARRALRDLLPDGAGDQTSTIEGLRRRVVIPACPICLAAGQMERRFLAWLCVERERRPQVLSEESHLLCAPHLHDLAETDAEAARWLLRWTAAAWLGDLSRVRRRWRGTRAAREALSPRLRSRPCSACAAVEIAEDGSARLLFVALADPPTARAYEDSHGVCLRHLLRLPEGKTTDLVRSIARARLDLLAWELEEASRKSSWHARHEPKAAEATAWLRAASLLDGRVFLGGPPRRL